MPTRPKCRRCRSRAPRRAPGSSSCASSHMTLVADWFGPTRTPSARSARHSPIVRRSCQPRPGPMGTPVARSQTIVEPRWFEMPTASTGPSASSAAVRELETTCWRGRSRRTPRAHRPVNREGARVRGPGRSSRRRAPPRRGCCSSRRRPRAHARSRRSRPGHRSEGSGEAELAGVQDAVRVEGVLHRLQHAEPVAERLGHEAGAVQADAVMVAQRAARREHRARARRPTRRGSTPRGRPPAACPANVK